MHYLLRALRALQPMALTALFVLFTSCTVSLLARLLRVAGYHLHGEAQIHLLLFGGLAVSATGSILLRVLGDVTALLLLRDNLSPRDRENVGDSSLGDGA